MGPHLCISIKRPVRKAPGRIDVHPALPAKGQRLTMAISFAPSRVLGQCSKCALFDTSYFVYYYYNHMSIIDIAAFGDAS